MPSWKEGLHVKKVNTCNKRIGWVVGWQHSPYFLFSLVENLGGRGLVFNEIFPETVPGQTGYLDPSSHGSALDLLPVGVEVWTVAKRVRCLGLVALKPPKPTM